MSLLLQNYDSVLPTFFTYPMKTRQNLQLVNFPIYSIQTDYRQFGFIFHGTGIVLKLGWNRSWEVKLWISYRDISAKYLSMRFSSWALQNILEAEGRIIYCQSCWKRSAGFIKEFEIKVGLINEFPLFCLSLPSPRHIFHSQLSILQHWSSMIIPMEVSLSPP